MKVHEHGNNLIQLTYYGFVNVYLVREEDGFTLVDTALESCARSIVQVARQFEQPSGCILLTHAHADHSGGLDAIHALVPEAQFVMTARDARFLSGDMSLDADEPRDKLRGGWVIRKTQPVRLVHQGDRVGSLEVIATPGYTPGHCSFLDTRNRILTAGDAFQTLGDVVVSGTLTMFPLPRFPPGINPPAWRARTSCGELSPSRLAVGHGRVLESHWQRWTALSGCWFTSWSAGKQAGDSDRGVKGGPTMVKQANLLLALLLELGVLAALAYWGFVTGATLAVKIVLGIGAPVAAIIIWAIWGAPRSRRRLQGISYWLLRIAFDARQGAIALYVANQHTWGVIFALVAALNCILGYVWKQNTVEIA